MNKRSKVDRGDILMPMIGTIGRLKTIVDFEKEFAIKKKNKSHSLNLITKQF